MRKWVETSDIYDVWPDAPLGDSNDYADSIIAAATIQCQAFAPPLAAESPVPENYKVAVAMQTRNLWNSSQASPSSGDLGGDSYAVPTFPMDWVVKGLLRPKRGRPLVG